MERQRVPRRLVAQLHRKFLQDPLSRPLASGFANNTYYGHVSARPSASIICQTIRNSCSVSVSISSESCSKRQGETLTAATCPRRSQIQNCPTTAYRTPPTRVEDPNEPISEAEDFEQFRMQTRMEKITKVANRKPRMGNIDKRCPLMSSTTKGAWRSYKRRRAEDDRETGTQ